MTPDENANLHAQLGRLQGMVEAIGPAVASQFAEMKADLHREVQRLEDGYLRETRSVRHQMNEALGGVRDDVAKLDSDAVDTKSSVGHTVSKIQWVVIVALIGALVEVLTAR